jgi:hypothetical protein
MEIINYKKNTNPNSILKASFTIKFTEDDLKRLGSLQLDCTFFEKENAEFWIN